MLGEEEDVAFLFFFFLFLPSIETKEMNVIVIVIWRRKKILGLVVGRKRGRDRR